MDQLPVEIKTDDYWNSQLHALLIFNYTSHQPCFLLYKCRIGEVIFTRRCFHDECKNIWWAEININIYWNLALESLLDFCK